LAFCGPVTLFNDFGFGIGNNAYCIGGNNAGCAGLPYQPAFAFTPGTTAYLTQIELSLYPAEDSGQEGSVIVSLMTNSGGLPGTVLEQWATTPGYGTLTLDSLANPLLTDGTQYWLGAADSLGGGGAIGWNTSQDLGSYADMETGSWVLGSSSAQMGYFEVDANTVNPQAPEPASLLTFSIGLVGLIAARAVKRRSHP